MLIVSFPRRRGFLFSETLRASFESSRAFDVAVLFQPQRQVDEGFVVIRIKIERLAIERGGIGFAGGIADQTEEIIGMRRRSVLGDVCFADNRGFGKFSGICELLCCLEVGGKARRAMDGRRFVGFGCFDWQA